MSEEREEKETTFSQRQLGDENQKVQTANKKKYEEDLEKIVGQIREKEGELEKIKGAGGMNITDELRNLKAEKSAAITKRKQIDQELEKLKKVIPEKMCQLGQLESSLVYKSEDKINTAIQRLEWNLKVQHFKLMEEKKIVSEIDRLGRSKKTLAQYFTLKEETSALRDSQRQMREERDTYFQAVGKLNLDEDRLRKNSNSAKTAYAELKQQIDGLYENKRQLVVDHKKQQEEYQHIKEKQRKESWKRREDYRKSVNADKRKEQVQHQKERTLREKAPHEKYINWCNSLIQFFSRFVTLPSQESSLDSLSPATSIEEAEPVEEIADGQFVLLRRDSEGQDSLARTKRPSVKNRKIRRQSSKKKIALSPDMLQQLSELGLEAPNSSSEVAETIENLKLKKVLLEKDQHSPDVVSDVDISSTRNTVCENFCEADNAGNCEGILYDPEHVCSEQLLERQEGHDGLSRDSKTESDGGGCEKDVGAQNPDGDSSILDDMESVKSQVHKDQKDTTTKILVPIAEVQVPDTDRQDGFKPGPDSSVMMSGDLQFTLKQAAPSGQEREEKEDPVALRSGDSLRSIPASGRRAESQQESDESLKPSSISQSSVVPLKSVSVTMSGGFPSEPALRGPQGDDASPVSSRSVCAPSSDQKWHISPVFQASREFSPAEQQTASAGNPSSSSRSVQSAQFSLTVPVEPALILDSEECPPLVRKGLCVSAGSCDCTLQESNTQSADQQIMSFDIYGQTAILVSQTHSGHELSSFHHPSQKSSESVSIAHICMSDQPSTEKWIESGMIFDSNFSPLHFEDNTVTAFTESTRL